MTALSVMAGYWRNLDNSVFFFEGIGWSIALDASMMTFSRSGILTIHPRSVCIDILGNEVIRNQRWVALRRRKDVTYGFLGRADGVAANGVSIKGGDDSTKG